MFTALLAAAVLAEPQILPADTFFDLFNGKDLTGWVVEGPDKSKKGDPLWSVADGKIACVGDRYGFLRYDGFVFSDFTVRVEYRFAVKQRGNSGLGVRTVKYDPMKSGATRPSRAAYEVQLMDDAGKPPSKHGTASLYRFHAPTANPTKPAPEWNTIEVTCRGPNITVTLNGEKVLDVDQSEDAKLKNKPLRGYIALQSHTGGVEFRKVQVRLVK